MLKQIKYFQSVVRNNSFTEAAEECFISQSAISQQIKVLEQELGVKLLKRSTRNFTLTPAGEYFYKKSLVLVADFEAICKETIRIASDFNKKTLQIGVLRGYNSEEFQCAIACFTNQFTDVFVEITYGNHDELYDKLRNNEFDIVINDQRRAFSDEYRNEILTEQEYCIEISATNPIAMLDSVDIEDLKNIPCILLSSKTQQITEQNFYQNDIGFKSEMIFLEHLEDAIMALVQGKGFMPIEGNRKQVQLGDVTKRVKLTRISKPIIRRYCAFVKTSNNTKYIEKFLTILKKLYKEM